MKNQNPSALNPVFSDNIKRVYFTRQHIRDKIGISRHDLTKAIKSLGLGRFKKFSQAQIDKIERCHFERKGVSHV